MKEPIEGSFIHNNSVYTPDECMDEKWVETDVSGYFVSDAGRVWSKKKEKLISGNVNKSGYTEFSLKGPNGERKRRYLHRMIAEGFKENPNHFLIVRHLDDDPTNNVADNLEWGTQVDNMRDARENGRNMPNFRTDKDKLEKANSKRRKKVVATNLKTKEKIEYCSQQEAARQLGIRQSDISTVVNGKQRTAHNYIFERGE